MRTPAGMAPHKHEPTHTPSASPDGLRSRVARSCARRAMRRLQSVGLKFLKINPTRQATPELMINGEKARAARACAPFV